MQIFAFTKILNSPVVILRALLILLLILTTSSDRSFRTPTPLSEDGRSRIILRSRSPDEVLLLRLLIPLSTGLGRPCRVISTTWAGTILRFYAAEAHTFKAHSSEKLDPLQWMLESRLNDFQPDSGVYIPKHCLRITQWRACRLFLDDSWCRNSRAV